MDKAEAGLQKTPSAAATILTFSIFSSAFLSMYAPGYTSYFFGDFP
jgi:hypothetical protein